MYVVYDVINEHEKFQVTTVCHSFKIIEGKIYNLVRDSNSGPLTDTRGFYH